jgi:hypothetical protein
LFYEALTVSEPDELPNLAFIAAGWSRRDPEELFRYTLSCMLAGIEAERGWLARARAEADGGGARPAASDSGRRGGGDPSRAT